MIKCSLMWLLGQQRCFKEGGVLPIKQRIQWFYRVFFHWEEVNYNRLKPVAWLYACKADSDAKALVFWYLKIIIFMMLFLVFYIRLYFCFIHISYRNCKIASCPHMLTPIALFKWSNSCSIFLALFPLIYWINFDTDMFGGIDTKRWTWSGLILPLTMST